MQDRFKFRAWNTQAKIMKEVSQLSLDKKQIAEYAPNNKVSIHLKFQPHFILMQCTGLKDKNGKPIYEGDILNVNTGSRNTSGYGVVEYWQSGCNFTVNGYLENPSEYYPRKRGEFCQHLQAWLCTEVIGNIYENPELLEDK